MDQVLEKLMETGLKLHLRKFTLAKIETEYLWYIITWNGIKLQPKKIEVILNMRTLEP